MAVKFTRHKVPGVPGVSVGHTYYTAHNGRFKVTPTWSRMGSGWSVHTTDGSTPFRGFGGKYNSSIYNGSSLAECRDEIEIVTEEV